MKKQIAKVKELLECSICFEIFKEPVTLNCQHTFCKNCINKVISKKCPLCNDLIKIPPRQNIILDSMIQSLFKKKSEQKTYVPKHVPEIVHILEQQVPEIVHILPAQQNFSIKINIMVFIFIFCIRLVEIIYHYFNSSDFYDILIINYKKYSERNSDEYNCIICYQTIAIALVGTYIISPFIFLLIY